MPAFGKRYKKHLATLHLDLQKVLNEAIKHWDFSILEGHRNKIKQNELYEKGKSKLQWPNSKHNSSPSKAADIAPYPINWEDHYRFHALLNRIIGIGAAFGINLRYGGDWDNDLKNTDQEFNDLVHLEIID
jgi:hypothetical protein